SLCESLHTPLRERQLIRKNAEMPEIGQPAERCYAQHLSWPACRQLPFAAPAAPLRLLLPVAALEDGIGLAPQTRRECGLPHRLRLGAIDGDTAKTVEPAGG